MNDTPVNLSELALTEDELGHVFGGQEEELAPCEEASEAAVM